MRLRPAFALLVAALTATYFAPAATAADRPVKSLLEFRQQNVIVQKYDLSCGAAALATILNFQFGDRVSEKDVNGGLIRRQEYIDHPEVVRVRQGFSLLDMKRYVDGRGYEGVGFGEMDIQELVKVGPAIVPVSSTGYSHFVVFRGLWNDQVLVADPAFGNRTFTLEKFERIWIAFPDLGRVAFIVTYDGDPAPPHGLAARASEFLMPVPRRGSALF